MSQSHFKDPDHTLVVQGQIGWLDVSMDYACPEGEFQAPIREQLRKATNCDQDYAIVCADELEQELATVREHQKRLLNLRLLEETDADEFATKHTERRDRPVELQSQIVAYDRDRNEIIDAAIRAFELSQNLRSKRFAADWATKRLVEIV